MALVLERTRREATDISLKCVDRDATSEDNVWSSTHFVEPQQADVPALVHHEEDFPTAGSRTLPHHVDVAAAVDRDLGAVQGLLAVMVRDIFRRRERRSAIHRAGIEQMTRAGERPDWQTRII